MALLDRINPFIKTTNDTGFGANASSYGGRFVNKDGSFNLRKEGVAGWKRASIYYNLLVMPTWKFLLSILVFFIAINFVFTGLYYAVGLQQLNGFYKHPDTNVFWEVYFFSCQTFTTVGYGRMNPVGLAADSIASAEALMGFLCFALATGLIYGRFTKPKSFLSFSHNALIAPYKGATGLMFRVVPFKDNHLLTDVEVRVNLAFTVQENGQATNKFYSLPLERSHVDTLSMNLTVVHPIDEQSPFLGLKYEDLQQGDAEVFVLIRGFDDVYSSNVLQRTSYTYEEMVFDAKFLPMYRESEDGKTTILELDKLNDFIKLN